MTGPATNPSTGPGGSPRWAGPPARPRCGGGVRPTGAAPRPRRRHQCTIHRPVATMPTTLNTAITSRSAAPAPAGRCSSISTRSRHRVVLGPAVGPGGRGGAVHLLRVHVDGGGPDLRLQPTDAAERDVQVGTGQGEGRARCPRPAPRSSRRRGRRPTCRPGPGPPGAGGARRRGRGRPARPPRRPGNVPACPSTRPSGPAGPGAPRRPAPGPGAPRGDVGAGFRRGSIGACRSDQRRKARAPRRGPAGRGGQSPWTASRKAGRSPPPCTQTEDPLT